MIIIPAIDLYHGNVVRLKRGDPSQSTVYSSDPLTIAKQWQEQGAKLVHVVDLDAALGEGDNLGIIEAIIKALRIDVEVGGGIRDLERAKHILSCGAKRIVIGTKSLDECFLDDLIACVGAEKLAAAVDVVDGCLAIEGWKKKTECDALEFIHLLQRKGLRWLIYTDVTRDGTLQGMDISQIQQLSTFTDMHIIASGGVSSIEDITRLKNTTPFVWGVITGKALYEQKIDAKILSSDF